MKKIISLSIILVLLFLTAPNIFAYEEYNYVIDNRGNKIPVATVYARNNVRIFFGEGVGPLYNPQHIFIDKSDNIYIVDSGNNRILKFNKNWEIKLIVDSDKVSLNNPQGIFVDDDGQMLIADTFNNRIVHVSEKGEFIEEFIEPEDSRWSNEYAFRPTKVYLDPIGQIYMINMEDYHGFTILDAFNKFRGYIAPTRIPFNLMDRLKEFVMTPQQREREGLKLPPVHSNMIIDDTGFIYTTTMRAQTQQFKKFSNMGVNVFPNEGQFGLDKQDYILNRYGKTSTEPRFVDLALDSSNIIYLLDNTSGRIYQYDQDGVLLSIFGGTGRYAGAFINAVSISINSDGSVFVLDSNSGSVHEFTPTAFAEKVKYALNLYYNGEYEKAIEPWREILKIDSGYKIAHLGMGKAYMKQRQWENAMEEYRAAGDKQAYSLAFRELRKDYFRKYFGVIIIILGAAVILLAKIFASLSKKQKSMILETHLVGVEVVNPLYICLSVIYEPTYAFNLVQRKREKYSYLLTVLLLISAVAVRISTIFIMHYPIAKMDPIYTNLGVQVTNMIVPLITWALGCYLVTTIRSGESYFREILQGVSLAMLPYIIFMIPIALLSNLMSLTDIAFFSYTFIDVLVIFIWGWVISLQVISLSQMNSYGLFETLKVVFISLLVCIFIWAVLALIYLLGDNVLEFIRTIFEEYVLNLFGS